MYLIKLLISLAISCAIVGCTYSVHPLFLEKDQIDTSDISGVWETNGDSATKERRTVSIEKHDDSIYEVTIEVPAKNRADSTAPTTAEFTLQVGKIDDQFYGQLIALDGPTGLPLQSGISVYLFARLEIDEQAIKFFPMINHPIDKLPSDYPVQHVMRNHDNHMELTILTDPSEQLKKLIREHGQVLFQEQPVTLRRKDIR